MSDAIDFVEAKRHVTLPAEDAERRSVTGGAVKRAFDLIGALAMLIVLAPVMLVLALAVLRIDGAPVFFRHTRVGFGGKTFRVFKFRTMRKDADRILKELLATDPEARASWELDQKLRVDPRVLGWAGQVMRKASLDELPQLLNVIIGDMSLVGPRPVVPDEIARYGAASHDYLSTRPGITGLWQVSGRNNTTYETRVALDSEYVRTWSLWNDIRILFRTVTTVVTGHGAY